MGGYQASFQFNLTDHAADAGRPHRRLHRPRARARAQRPIDATPDAEEWWVQEVIANRGKTNRNKECTPGYYNFEGEDQRRQDGNYNGTFLQYYQHMQNLKKDIDQHFNFG